MFGRVNNCFFAQIILVRLEEHLRNKEFHFGWLLGQVDCLDAYLWREKVCFSGYQDQFVKVLIQLKLGQFDARLNIYFGSLTFMGWEEVSLGRHLGREKLGMSCFFLPVIVDIF